MRISVGSMYPIFPAGWGGNRFLAPMGPERGSLEGLGDAASDFYDGSVSVSDPLPSPADIQAANDYNSWIDTNGGSTFNSTPSTSGLTSAQLASIISTAGQAAISIAKATSTPSVIPGTGLVYNPATGQFLPSSGAVAGTAQIASSFSQYIPLAILAIGALFVLKAAK